MKIMKIIITIGEPWNFEGPDGNNLIKGRILRNINDKYIIFMSDYEQKFNQIAGRIFILSTRYSNDSFSVFFKDSQKESISINGSLLTEKNICSLDEDEIAKKSMFIFIGSIRKE